jgi:hypothetical protein
LLPQALRFDPRQVRMSVRITAQAVTRRTEVKLTFRPNVINETPNRASLATVTEQRRVNQSLGER